MTKYLLSALLIIFTPTAPMTPVVMADTTIIDTSQSELTASTTKPASILSSDIIDAINQGQRIFLLKDIAKDKKTHWYFVGVPKARILESFPEQINIVRFFDGLPMTVLVTDLIHPEAQWFNTVQSEIFSHKSWQNIESIIYTSGNLYAPTKTQIPVWRSVSLGEVRFKSN